MKRAITSSSAGHGTTDWNRLRALPDEETVRSAGGNPDNRPVDVAAADRSRRVSRVKIIRRALGLTQEQFSGAYRIPLGTLRDWEQGRSEPDQATKAYLRVIASDPQAVLRALGAASAA